MIGEDLKLGDKFFYGPELNLVARIRDWDEIITFEQIADLFAKNDWKYNSSDLGHSYRTSDFKLKYFSSQILNSLRKFEKI